MSNLILNNVDVHAANGFTLRNISFTLNPGELIGVLGPNGAGKSTLAKTLVGLLATQGGEIRYDKKHFASLSHKQRAALIGYLPQHATFSWDLPIKDAIALGRTNNTPADQEQSTLNKVMADVGLTHLANRTVMQLSGGEQMRVHLARLFYGQHQTLIMDEPCASLDIEHQHRVLGLLRSALPKAGALVILHDFTLAQLFCDKLILLDAGEIRLFGKPQTILESPITAQVFGVHFEQFVEKTAANKLLLLPSINSKVPE